MLDIKAPQRGIPLTHTKKLGNIEFIGYLKSHPETAPLIFSIQKYLENHPPFYLASLLAEWKGLTLEAVKPKLQLQQKSLIEGKSFLHLINNAFESRKRCLNKIRRDITKSTKFLALFPQQYFGQTVQDEAFVDWVEVQGYSVVDVDESVQESIKAISSIFVDMVRLRDMTIYLVEQIHSWRMRIEEHLDRCQQHSQIKFYYDNENVYESILEDSKFIWNSKLSQYIMMEAKQDPFVIRNVLLVQQKTEKGLLEKYFVEIVYPKNEENIDQAVRCFEMLAYKFKPKLYNRFEEEELLIENYLKMEMNAHQFDQPEEGLKIRKPSSASPEEKSKSPKQVNSPPEKQKNKLSARGWIFEKHLKTPHRERVNQIIESHKGKMGLIKPYNISNYSQKKSIALAYLSQIKSLKQKDRSQKKRKISIKFGNKEKKYTSQGEEGKIPFSSQRGIQSEPEKIQRRGFSQSKMFRSLSKLHPIIYQDPKEHVPDTPKNKSKEKESKQFNNYESDGGIFYGKQSTLQHAKINSFFQESPQKDKISKIEVQEEETPLNLSKFYQVFRADTNKPPKNKESMEGSRKNHLKEADNQKLTKIRQFIDKIRNQRTERAKSLRLPYAKKIRYSLPKSKRKDKSRQIEKSLSKSRDSYKDFQKIEEKKLDLPKNSNQLKKMFLGLKAKSIPIDLIPAYVKYLESCLPQKSRFFIHFDSKALVQKLSDPSIHSIIFNITSENHTSVGTIVLSQSLGGRGGKLKYMMQFMSVQPFQLVSVTILRVAQELLSATPCQQVAYLMRVDRLDLVSSHFIDIIDSQLMEGVQKFGKLVIMERSLPSLTGSDLRERIYVFTSTSNTTKLYGPKLQMMGNYRSLKFECKCLVLTSNFRLRSDNLQKDTLHKYLKVALGELFAKTFIKIMTNYHLKQLRQASFGGQGELGEAVRKDPFVRAILYAAVTDIKEKTDELLKTTSFSNMEDLLNYLRYKNHDEYFHFQFLAESRFILQHQLVLVELDQEFSLQFTLTSNKQLYILHNHKNLQLTTISSSKIDVPAFLLPTTNEKVSLFLMPASQYLQRTTDRIDLYSYLTYFLRYKDSEKYLNQVPSIVLPNLHEQSKRINKVRMFDGFFKLFPEREFYSAAAINCINHWESYYDDAVIHEPLKNSLLFQFPFIVGVYNQHNKILLSAFLYSEQSESPRN